MAQKSWQLWLGPGWLALVIATMPLNLFLKWILPTSYLHGLLSDYLIPKLYLSDLVILGWLGTIAAVQILTHPTNWLRQRRWQWWLLGLGVMLLPWFANQSPILAWSIAKFSFMLALVIYLSRQPSWWHHRWVKFSLALSLLFQSSLTIFQWLTQRPLLPYYWLGESNLRQATGLATVSWWGSEKILPYGTTPHPNVLAGILVGYWIWWATGQTSRWQAGQWLVSGLTFLALALTQSWSSWLAAGLAVGCLVVRRQWPRLSTHQLVAKLILGSSLLMLVAVPLGLEFGWHRGQTDPSVTRRVILNRAAWNIWQAHPRWGVGVGQNVAATEPLTLTSEKTRFNQPTHHVGLLALSELGLLGGVWLGLGGYWWYVANRSVKSNRWAWWHVVWLVPILALDHYPLSLQMGQWLLLMSLALSLTATRELEMD